MSRPRPCSALCGRDRGWTSRRARSSAWCRTRPPGAIPELDIHLRFALKEGWTEDELTEVLLHLTGYVGVPIIREAMLVAAEVFKDVKAKGGGKA